MFVSGHLAKRADGTIYTGQLGGLVSLEEGLHCARAVAIDLLATLRAACDGDLGKVRRVVKVLGLVNSTPTFTDQHLVINGCSSLLNEVFNQTGAHARSAFGVAQLPLGACVEIELVVELGDVAAASVTNLTRASQVAAVIAGMMRHSGHAQARLSDLVLQELAGTDLTTTLRTQIAQCTIESGYLLHRLEGEIPTAGSLVYSLTRVEQLPELLIEALFDEGNPDQ